MKSIDPQYAFTGFSEMVRCGAAHRAQTSDDHIIISGHNQNSWCNSPNHPPTHRPRQRVSDSSNVNRMWVAEIPSGKGMIDWRGFNSDDTNVQVVNTPKLRDHLRSEPRLRQLSRC